MLIPCTPEYMPYAFRIYDFDTVVDAAFRFARMKIENEINKKISEKIPPPPVSAQISKSARQGAIHSI